MKQQDTYSLKYYVNNVCKETVIVNAPKAVCYWKKNQIKNTTHKLGTLKVEKVK